MPIISRVGNVSTLKAWLSRRGIDTRSIPRWCPCLHFISIFFTSFSSHIFSRTFFVQQQERSVWVLPAPRSWNVKWRNRFVFIWFSASMFVCPWTTLRSVNCYMQMHLTDQMHPPLEPNVAQTAFIFLVTSPLPMASPRYRTDSWWLVECLLPTIYSPDILQVSAIAQLWSYPLQALTSSSDTDTVS